MINHHMSMKFETKNTIFSQRKQRATTNVHEKTATLPIPMKPSATYSIIVSMVRLPRSFVPVAYILMSSLVSADGLLRYNVKDVHQLPQVNNTDC